MNIHEYQAKKLLKKFKIEVKKGAIAYTPLEALKAAKKISKDGPWVLKAQIQSGARAKGHFIQKGAKKISGVEVAHTDNEVFELAQKMLSNVLVTPQTTPSAGASPMSRTASLWPSSTWSSTRD